MADEQAGLISALRVSFKPLALILLVSTALRGCLMYFYPAFYGGDSVIYVKNHDQILLGHQLPALQVLIFLTYKISHSPMAARILMVVLGYLAAWSFYLLGTSFLSRREALFAALFFVTNPFLNEVSLVPYTETLMLAAVCLAVWCYVRGRVFLCSLFLALACLARYEAWIVCPILVFDYLNRSRNRWRDLSRAFGIFCWAPILWICMHRGLSPHGTSVIDIPHSALRVVRWVYLGWITMKTVPVPVIVFAVAGMWLLFQAGLLANKRIRLAGAGYLLFLIALLFSAHGDSHSGSASPELFVSSREATFPIAGVLMLAGLGMRSFARRPGWKLLLIGAAMCLGIVQSASYIRAQGSHPEIQLSFRLARYLDAHVQPGESVSILAKPLPEVELHSYSDAGTAAKPGGLMVIDLSPADFQRTAVQCAVPSERLISSDSTNAVWTAVWSDAPIATKTQERLKRIPVIATLTEPPLSVNIYRAGSGSLNPMSLVVKR